tara:strand:+ start:1303 stop:1554 length:252 start_codon:yes stop_codon:yes gene_type:complete
MKITAYTTSNCFYCDQLKTLLRRANLEWENIPVTGEKERSEVRKKYPNMKGFPHVIVDDVELGGLVNTAKFLVKKGLISAETK